MRIEYCEPEGYYLLGLGEYAEVSAAAVLERLKVATGTKKQAELARWLGIRQALLSDAQRRNIFPAKWLYLLLEKQTYYNPVWVLTGKGEARTEKWCYTVAGLRAVIPVSYKS